MGWNMEQIKRIFSSKDLQNGILYQQRGQVTHLQSELSNGQEFVRCQVTGSQTYDVSFSYDKNSVQVSCTCPRFAEKHICKHVAAGMLAHAAMGQQGAPMKSDFYIKSLLKTYLEQSQQQALQNREARLVPCLHTPITHQYPTFSFRVGFEKLYVVRDIRAFVDHVAQEETFSYGKGLTLCHSLSQFDPHAQQLIQVLMDQFLPYRNFSNRYSFLNDSYEQSLWINRQRNQICLTGSAFDRWFDLLREHPVELDGGRQTVLFEDGIPQISLTLGKQARSAQLRIETDQYWSFFGSTRQMYALGQNRLLRCSSEFQSKVYPLLKPQKDTMSISFSDLPTFCSCVLPQIKEQVEIQDPQGLLEQYLPDECTPLFAFDLKEDTLLLHLTFRYGETIADPGSKKPVKGVKRDAQAESAAQRLAERYFTCSSPGQYSLSGEDAVFDFLTQSLPPFQEQGEVLLSDRLRARKLQPHPAAVGISLSNGLLRLELDGGGFPLEELEALYQSLLKKRRYYRLTDGRFLALDGSSAEKLAEMAHMLQLSPKELATGSVQLPAFRSLYLDGLLSGNEGVHIRRDKQFRAMVRNFKSIDEADYPIPQHLEDVLRPYQKTGFLWLKTLESCGFGGILADEMGLGKTAQVIAFLSTVTSDRPSLVVCPASLILNWKDELTKFAPNLEVALMMGTAAERKAIMARSSQAQVWVTSYELLRQDIKYYQEQPFYCCILDEGQHIKNQSTLVSKAVKQVDCQQRFVLTGTPIENRLSELWNLFDFLMPGYLFSHKGFVDKLEKPVVKSGDSAAAAQLRRLVQPFILRRLKQDVLKELPPKIEYVRKIPLSEEERKVYHASAMSTRQSFQTGEQGKLAILAALTQLRQICCAPGLCFENYEGASSKLEAALELCAAMVENGHQILLFSQFTSMLDLIRQGLDALHISHFTLQGSTSKEKRAQLVKSFNAGGASVFLISLKAGGTGLNLTAADVVIHYDPWWNLAAQDQATDRAHRIGQQSHVQVYKLIAKDTIEERILELQSKKAALMDTISGGPETSILDLSKEDLLALLE